MLASKSAVRIQTICSHVAPASWTRVLGVAASGSGHARGIHTSAARAQKVLTVENMNPHVKNMEYAVRGPIVIRAGEIEQELQSVSTSQPQVWETMDRSSNRLEIGTNRGTSTSMLYDVPSLMMTIRRFVRRVNGSIITRIEPVGEPYREVCLSP